MEPQIDFRGRVILAPMAGVTDLPFRVLCREQGCNMLYTEMVSAKAIWYNNKNTEPLIRYLPEDQPIGCQLFGSEPELMADMALRMEDRGFAFIDVNMGCPVPKVFNNGEGSALMKDPALIGKIVHAMKSKLHIPLTVKIRKGVDDDHVNAVEVAKICEEEGVDAIAIHARTRMQYYSGEADWNIIREIKDAVKIPVIGNGDITSYADVLRMKEETGCDSVMIGRAARGNPWIFDGSRTAPPTKEEVIRMIRRHMDLMVEHKGEFTAVREMRKHVSWYTAGYPHSTKLRGLVNEVETVAGMDELLNRWQEEKDVR